MADKKIDFKQMKDAATELARGIELAAPCRCDVTSDMIDLDPEITDRCFEYERRRPRERGEHFRGERTMFAYDVRNMCHRCQTVWHARMLGLAIIDLTIVEWGHAPKDKG